MPDNDCFTYRSYLLRLWRHGTQGTWCASLENVRTEQTHHFAGADELWAFLQAEMEHECSQKVGLIEPEPVGVPGPPIDDGY